MYVRLDTQDDIEKFVKITSSYGNDITASANGNLVSAKSEEALRKLCMGKYTHIHIDTRDSDLRREFFTKIDKWRVE